MCIRDREAGDFILAGITTRELLNATDMAIEMKQKGVLGKPCPDSVSYTHLDVYTRQALSHCHAYLSQIQMNRWHICCVKADMIGKHSRDILRFTHGE